MKKTAEDRAVDYTCLALLILVLLIVVIPFLTVFASAFESQDNLMEKGMVLFPRNPTLSTFAFLFQGQIGAGKINIWLAFFNSVVRTAAGTVLSIAIQLALAYALTFKKLRFCKTVNILMIITMFVSGGLIPTYLIFNSFGMNGTVWPLIILGAVSPYTVYIMRNFLASIPYSLTEAGYLDGANEFQIFRHIIFPLSLAIVATYSLFAAVAQWNDWFTAYIYLNDEAKYPLMLVLKEIITESGKIQPGAGSSLVKPNEAGLNCAAIVIVMIPMLAVYPFVQKYFVQGTMLGSVKE